jgi:hypothetical protein
MELYIPWYKVYFVVIYSIAGKNSDVNASQSFPLTTANEEKLTDKVFHTHTQTIA